MSTEHDIAAIRIDALERIVARGQVWSRMAAEYDVTNPVPPWKTSLDATCDALDQQATALPLPTRRDDEDRLSREVYGSLPYPENQLVALAHSLIARNVIDRTALADRLAAVRARVEAGALDTR
jgi:hypothetical protein